MFVHSWHKRRHNDILRIRRSSRKLFPTWRHFISQFDVVEDIEGMAFTCVFDSFSSLSIKQAVRSHQSCFQIQFLILFLFIKKEFYSKFSSCRHISLVFMTNSNKIIISSSKTISNTSFQPRSCCFSLTHWIASKTSNYNRW